MTQVMQIYHALLLLLPLALLSVPLRRGMSSVLAAGLVVALAIALSGLRWDADVDHLEYAAIYADTPTLPDFSPESIQDLHGEPGYHLVGSLFRTVGAAFYVVSFLCALFAIGAKALVAARLVRSAAVVMVLYFCLHFITIEFIQIRWAMASACITLAFLAQLRRRLALAAVFFAVAVSFHYFSLLFLVVAALVALPSERVAWALLGAAGAFGALMVSGSELPIPEFLVGDAYILQRTVRYLSETLSTVGPASYAKLAAYPLLYALLTFGYPSLGADPDTAFLRRLSFTCLALTLMLSIIPLMHHRAVVVADFFSLLLLVRVVERRFTAGEWMPVLAALALPFCTWYALDVGTNLASANLYEYKTWLPLLR